MKVLPLKRLVRNNWIGRPLAISVGLSLIGWLLPHAGFSQVDSLRNRKELSDCEASLAIATAEFNAGRFFSLPSILQECLQRGFTREQQVRAYILLCQVYLINDNPAEAEASYIKLLQADPEYVATPEIDPIDVVYLSQKFTTRPVFTPSFKTGLGTSFTSLIYDQNPAPDSVVINRSLKIGWSLGGGIDWNMSDRVSLSLDVLWNNQQIQRTNSSIHNRDIGSQTVKLSWIDLPLAFKYQDYVGRWRPFAYAGYGFHFRLTSKEDLTYINNDGEPSSPQQSSTPTAGSDIVFTDRQNFFNRSIVFGGGMKYKLNKNYLVADLRVNIGLSNVTNTKNNIDPASVDYTLFGNVNDWYRVNTIQILVGYVIPYYNPRKKGGWQPKGFIGKILYGNKDVTK